MLISKLWDNEYSNSEFCPLGHLVINPQSFFQSEESLFRLLYLFQVQFYQRHCFYWFVLMSWTYLQHHAVRPDICLKALIDVLIISMCQSVKTARQM
jgi:hypothetical protein